MAEVGLATAAELGDDTSEPSHRRSGGRAPAADLLQATVDGVLRIPTESPSAAARGDEPAPKRRRKLQPTRAAAGGPVEALAAAPPPAVYYPIVADPLLQANSGGSISISGTAASRRCHRRPCGWSRPAAQALVWGGQARRRGGGRARRR